MSCMVEVRRPNEENWGFLITQRTHVINFHYFGRLRKSPLYSRNHFELVAFPAAYPM